MVKTLKYYPFKMCFTIDKPIRNDLQYTGKKSIIGNILKPRKRTKLEKCDWTKFKS